MGIAEQMEQVIKHQLRAHVAWLPITNTYNVGDYGVIAKGVFTKIGNIEQEFGINLTQAKGADATLDFTSDSTRIIKFAGGTEVSVIPAGAIDAKVTLRFEREKSLLIKAPTISVTTIENVRSVFEQLKGTGNWNKRHIIVFQTYFANDANIVSTLDAGTEISFSGDAKALEQLKLGNADIGINANKKVGLQLLGKAGVIALGLVRLRTNFLEKPIVFLGPDDQVDVEELNEVTLEDDL